MQSLKKLTQNKQLLYTLLFMFVFLLTRLPRLNNDVLNTDAVMWHERSEFFIEALKTGDLIRTYQRYHPGVTLMWLTGVSFELTRFMTPGVIRGHHNFEVFHYIAKTFLVFHQLGLTLIALYGLSKLLDFKKSLLIVALFSLEPFFLGNSRLLHLDIIFTLYLFNALLFTYLNIKDFSVKKTVVASLFLALAVLTKSIAVGAVLYISIVGSLFIGLKTTSKNGLKHFALITVFFMLFTLMFFPALWVAPIKTITNLFTESYSVGVSGGHTQFFYGVEFKDPGFWFYPIVLLLKLSPVIVIGALLSLASLFARENFKFIKGLVFGEISLETFLIVFYLGYMAVMTLATKKIDRYILPLIPFLSLISIQGYFWFYKVFSVKERVSNILRYIFVTLLFFFILIPLVTVFPYYFTYTSPFFGSTQNANEVVGQKSFGVGVFELREHIIKYYGPDRNLAMTDEGPLKEIYGSHRVYDFWKKPPSDWDLMILGPNEPYPSLVEKSGKEFRYVESIKINGLDYWRIFKKQ